MAVKKKANRKQYSPELWVTLRILYESGQFSSVEQLHKHYKISFPDQRCPSIDSIKIHCANEGWNKHISDAEIAEKKAESIEEIFESLGMSRTERIKRVVSGIKLVDDIGSELVTLVSEMKTKIVEAQSEEQATEFAGAFEKVVDQIPKMLEYQKVALKYLENAQKLCGDNAPVKNHIMGDALKPKVAREYDKLTDEELEAELLRLEKNGA